MLIFFFHICISTLKNGDNPYKILGISKTATRQEIKKAFRNLTFQLHPDHNKKEDTTSKWVRVNDAYELLSDPDRKAMFDRFGVISDGVPISERDENPFGDINEHFYKNEGDGFDKVNPKTPLVTVVNFDDFIKDGNETLFLIYSSLACPECQTPLKIFENFAERFQKYCRCARIDVAFSSALAQELGANGMPTVLYYRKDENGKVVSDYINSRIVSVLQISIFLAQHWDIQIYRIKNAKDFDSFMKYSKGTVRVIQFGSGHETTLQYIHFVKLFSKKASFGFIEKETQEFVTKFNIRIFPSYLMFQNRNMKPKIFTNLGNLRNEINNYGYNLMLKLHRYNFYEECFDGCFIRCGEVTGELLDKFSHEKFSTYFVDNNSKIIKRLEIENCQWFFINLKDNYYAKVKSQSDEIKAIKDFIKTNEYEKKELPNGSIPDFDIYMFYLHVFKKYEKKIYSIFKGKGTLVLFTFAALFDITWYLTKFHKKKARKTRNETKRRHKIGLTNEEVKSIEEEKKQAWEQESTKKFTSKHLIQLKKKKKKHF